MPAPLVPFFLFAIAVNSALRCDENKLVTPAMRATIVAKLNNLRSRLAFGMIRKDFPFVRNVYKVSYSCELERSAQTHVERCVFEHSRGCEFGENLFMTYSNSLEEPSVTEIADDAVQNWWSEVERMSAVNENAVELRYSEAMQPFGHFIQIARGDLRRFGCGYATCGKQHFFFCHFDKGNTLTSAIFDFGHSCNSDSDCTSYEHSICVLTEGLCDADSALNAAENNILSAVCLWMTLISVLLQY